MGEIIASLDSGANTADAVNHEIEEIWRDLKAHPQRIPPGLELDLDGDPPVQVEQDGANVGIVETLLVAAATALVKDAATTLWKEVIWPELKKRTVGLSERT